MVYIETDVKTEKLKRGDHIGALNSKFKVEYQHHGIYLGHIGVAHFSGDSKKDAKVQVVSLKTFCSDLNRYIRFVYVDGECYDDEAAATNAESWVEHPEKWPAYNLLVNNCEHFATVCKTGVKRSKQASAKIDKLLTSGILVPGKHLAKASKGCSGSSGSGN